MDVDLFIIKYYNDISTKKTKSNIIMINKKNIKVDSALLTGQTYHVLKKLPRSFSHETE